MFWKSTVLSLCVYFTWLQVRDLHKYDCLRANKATMAWGLEARVPFLDREFLEYVMNLDPAVKMAGNRVEKWILRKAFDVPEDPFLPEEVSRRLTASVMRIRSISMRIQIRQPYHFSHKKDDPDHEWKISLNLGTTF